MPSILITGANRGIGLAFARHAAAEGWRVLASCRDPDRAHELGAIEGAVSRHALDIAAPKSIAALGDALAGESIDVLVNNAGIIGNGAKSLGALDFEAWADAFRVNVMGPVALTDRLAENVARSERRLVVCISSQMGSPSAGGGGYYAYRTSKAALNMAVVSLADDLARHRITVVAFHPGWVRTGMGGSGAPLSPEDSVARMWRTMARLTPNDSGSFLDQDGARLAW